MNCPPPKRLRGLNQDVVTAMPFDDPFGDDDGFTQDDLDEIDIIASQAVTSTAAAGHERKPAPKPTEPARGSAWSSSAGSSKSANKTTNNQSRENTFGFGGSTRGNAGTPKRELHGSRQQQLGSDREDSHRQLEAQHAELKRKLKEVEEEIVLKSGEIRVLRDSLKGTQQEKEAQRQNQILLETQRQREHSEREKELNRKVQSLQTELQFKEAEINEMKIKLNTDKNKTASPLPRHSPKVLSSLAQLHHGSSGNSSSPTGNGFITKEMFGAGIPTRTTPVKTRRDDRGSSSKSGDRLEVTRPDPFLSVRPAHLQPRGGVLLGLLLQQPLSPSSLGLSHLLSMSLTDDHLTSRLSGGFPSEAAAGVSAGGDPRAAPSPVQSLAVTGLNMLSQSRAEAAASGRNQRSCPGAVLLLPLLDLLLSRLCQALDTLRSSSPGGAGSNSAAASSAPSAGPGILEETGWTGFSVEDAGLAALRLLYLLLAHSDEVVQAVLSRDGQSRDLDMKAECSAADVGLCSQNALLQSVLRLCEAGTGESSSQREELVLGAMKTLSVLIQRTKDTHTDRFECVLQVVCACLSADSRLHTVSECVSVLTSMSDRHALSQHDPCVFLKLFHFIRTRPDNQATHADWTSLDLQVVRLLSRLMTQRSESFSSQRSACPCNAELVQTAVIVFHRQWLDLRGAPELTDSTGLTPPSQQCPAPSSPWWRSTAASLLRECLLLLHWLLLHHGSFSESCRPLLHMYDQVIPAVRDTLRKIPELSESEEIALEEICRSEGDDTDDMDTDTGS